MKIENIYITHDKKQHSTFTLAENYCLDKACLILDSILRKVNIQGSYKLSKDIINDAKIIYKLEKLLSYLKDVKIENNDNI